MTKQLLLGLTIMGEQQASCTLATYNSTHAIYGIIDAFDVCVASFSVNLDDWDVIVEPNVPTELDVEALAYRFVRYLRLLNLEPCDRELYLFRLQEHLGQ